ncbi:MULTISPECIES: urease accessory protein UreD [Ramlibacter]|uniref:Urease accessory protein UreD n=1 Tax=Ramlibacter pinisoli TaxID=2682844 RepID=A0A6N8ISH0_9BURK|nr:MULTISPECIES: urease accessory protein UreD [Ramlibacter]MBA2964904.1 urease accessory protein UreD [Ramlibacter sp. CGMCC 1.13660]MVQ29869.1 urease accessory protein UreD [Ramlibacter pinisoli]
MTGAGWHARLRLQLALEGGRSVARFEHDGPLRVLQTLYPEGDAVCHNVLVHPPGGLVGGDVLDIAVEVGAGAHGLVTTPGAARFYRSDGAAAVQRTRLRLEAGARFEWLPLETLCYSGCLAENRLQLSLAPGAELLAWDITALGLPASGQPFVAGRVLQELALEQAWLERGRIAGANRRLMDGPLGLAGHRCVATLVLAAGDELTRTRRELALDSAREVLQGHALAATAGATSPCGQAVVVRVLAPLVEPAMDLLRQVRAAWRQQLWQLEPTVPRLWAL